MVDSWSSARSVDSWNSGALSAKKPRAPSPSTDPRGPDRLPNRLIGVPRLPQRTAGTLPLRAISASQCGITAALGDPSASDAGGETSSSACTAHPVRSPHTSPSGTRPNHVDDARADGVTPREEELVLCRMIDTPYERKADPIRRANAAQCT